MNEFIPYFERLKLIKQGLLPKEAVAKPKKPIAKVSKKRKLENEKIKTTEVNSEIDRWFIERRKEMTGYCCECGKKSFKEHDKHYKWSLAHIIKKSIFKSVATHPSNFIELCWLHHQEFDSSYENAQKMNCWSIAKQKFDLFKNCIVEKHKDLNWFKNN